MSTHECVDQSARDAIRHARDEHAESLGKILGEIGQLHDRMAHMATFLGAPSYVRQHLNGNRSHPSLADIVEEATNPGTTRTSNPVRAAVERWTGKAVLWGLSLLLAGAAAILAENLIRALLAHH